MNWTKALQSAEIFLVQVEKSISKARNALLSQQHEAGHWCYEFEADCTIPAEYILMMHFMDEIDSNLQERIARYLRANQRKEGGWPLYPGGAMNISCSVKSYYALKLAGDDPESDHMRYARKQILEAGGAERSNVFTRIMLAQFQQIPWRGVPFIPVELMYAPRWLFFQIYKVSYWSRTVMVPLFILVSLKRTAHNPSGTDVQELFRQSPEAVRDWFPVRSLLNRLFLMAERTLRHVEPYIPDKIRAPAIRKAEQWMVLRLNGEGGLGSIFPAMINAYEALDTLGYQPGHPLRQQAKKALELLLVERGDMSYCQPCVPPVWDTALAVLALHEAGNADDAIRRSCGWLCERQLLDQPGDWQVDHPNLPGGGWAFQYRNDYYPDLDDTSAVAWGMQLTDPEGLREPIRRAADWVAGMQSSNGGFASFDSDNISLYLNEIPFADHGALLDPPTEDVTARCVALFSLLGDRYRKPLDRAIDYLTHKQTTAGAWWGRWGTNYIYGTWSVLIAFELAGIPPADSRIQKAVAWLKSIQQPDGSFGESNDTYNVPPALPGTGSSTPEQTAWALLALMAGGVIHDDAVRHGIQWLMAQQNEAGTWAGPKFNAPGFPRVFYLRYHGYSEYFPLWALARYRNLAC